MVVLAFCDPMRRPKLLANPLQQQNSLLGHRHQLRIPRKSPRNNRRGNLDPLNLPHHPLHQRGAIPWPSIKIRPKAYQLLRYSHSYNLFQRGVLLQPCHVHKELLLEHPRNCVMDGRRWYAGSYCIVPALVD